MKIKKFRKKNLHLILIFIFTFFFSSENLFSQQSYPEHTLNPKLPDWYLVAGGNALCKPARTSYGFVCLTEGKIVSAITWDGKLLWQKSFSFTVKPFISTGLSDIIFLVTGKDAKTITYLSPSGSVILEAKCPFEITSNPVQGKDGRIFVYGSSSAACFGLNGICKWNIEFESSLDPLLSPAELNDGSYLFFLTKTSEGKTVAARVNAFGKLIENITFASRIIKTAECRDGVLLLFTDSSAGFCKAENDTVISKWVFAEKNISALGANKEGTIDLQSVYVKQNETLYFVNSENGKTQYTLEVKGFKESSSIRIEQCEEGLMLTDGKKAAVISSQKKILYTADFSAIDNYIHILPPYSGHIVFLTKDWSVKAWHLLQNVKSKSKQKTVYELSSYLETAKKGRRKNFNVELKSSSLTGALADKKTINRMYSDFEKGNYGEREAGYLTILKTEAASFEEDLLTHTKDFRAEESWYKSHSDYAENIFTLCSKSGTALFSKNIALLIKNTTDSSFYRIFVQAAANTGYDENYAMIKAINSSLKKFSPDDDAVFFAVCDAVASICRYMGKDCYTAYGEGIISTLLYSGYSEKIHEYAVSTLTKINSYKL